MTEPMHVRLAAVRDRPKRWCAVPGCNVLAHRVGTRCRRHAAAYERHGHVEGRALPRSLWMPWRDEAERFIRDRRSHLGIKNALGLLSGMIREASPPSRITRRTRAHDRFQAYLASMRQHEVDPVKLLATVSAIHAVRQVDARYFKGSDRAFWFALAAAFLSATPRPKHTSGRIRGNGRASTVDPSAHLREHVGRVLTSTMGVLAESIASELIRRQQAFRPIPGQHVPFSDNPNPTED